MNKVLIVDASESDRRLMAGLLVKSGYEPIAVETIEAAKDEVAKLPPGAVVVAGLKFSGGTARELVNVFKEAPYKQPLIAIVENSLRGNAPRNTDSRHYSLMVSGSVPDAHHKAMAAVGVQHFQ